MMKLAKGLMALKTFIKFRKAGIYGVLSLIIIVSAIVYANSSDKTAAAIGPAKLVAMNLLPDVKDMEDMEPYYPEVLQQWEKQGYKAAEDKLDFAMSEPSGHSGNSDATVGSYEGRSNVLLWKNEAEGWIDYQVDIRSAGLYRMDLSYHPVQGSQKPIIFSVLVDGKYPFREARAVKFDRAWRDELPLKQDDHGDDIRPSQEDTSGWMTMPFRDSEGAYAAPLQWYFSAGKHTIRLTGSESVLLQSIVLSAPQAVPAYEQAVKSYPSVTANPTQTVIVEAENVSSKNNSAITLDSDADPLTVPKASGHVRYNTVTEGLSKGGDSISWMLDVPESGRYKVAFRYKQDIINNKSSFGTIYIDGQVPFSELYAYRFPYRSDWKAIELSDDSGKPYDFYLTKGKHTLTLETTHAPVRPFIIVINKLTALLRVVGEDLEKLTAGQQDANRTWLIERDMPDMPGRLASILEQIKQLSASVQAVNGSYDDTAQGLDSAARDLESLLKSPNEIPNKKKSITELAGTIANLPAQLLMQPIQLDRIYVAPVDQPLPKSEAGLIQKTGAMLANFYYSFTRKDHLSVQDDNVLNVWMFRGRDYVNLLQQLSDEMFTPKTGIKVKVNLVPDQRVLIMANAAGIQPDVAIGLTSEMPVDLAMRGSLLDLSQFPDFQEQFARYSPGSFLPFYYDRGYYGLPETQTFNILYYRKDIFNRLGLKVPQTWDDVHKMLPTLQQNNMNFYVNPSDPIPYFYQNGADFFTPDGMKTALNSPQSFKAFKQWTGLFTTSGLDMQIPSFYQHFRNGDMPVGISDFDSTFRSLKVAAPELNGWWGVAPIPGIRQEDGHIARWTGANLTASVISKSSKKKDQAWEYLKWWMSAEVQERYGTNLEQFNGQEFRWNTANIEAFTKLPWQKNELDAILQGWSWVKQMPNLPGSYFVSRELNNAWNRTAVDGANYRDSLEEAIKNINREMLRKEREFDLTDADGNYKHTLDLPQILQPWEGVNKYVSK